MHVVPIAQSKVQEGLQEWVKPRWIISHQIAGGPRRACGSHSSLHVVHEVVLGSLQTHVKDHHLLPLQGIV